jgi:hypothetical protein
MKTDLTYTEKFLVQVERLREANEPTAEFSVHFLSQVCKELNDNFKVDLNVGIEPTSNNVDGVRFK